MRGPKSQNNGYVACKNVIGLWSCSHGCQLYIFDPLLQMPLPWAKQVKKAPSTNIVEKLYCVTLCQNSRNSILYLPALDLLTWLNPPSALLNILLWNSAQHGWHLGNIHHTTGISFWETTPKSEIIVWFLKTSFICSLYENSE